MHGGIVEGQLEALGPERREAHEAALERGAREVDLASAELAVVAHREEPTRECVAVPAVGQHVAERACERLRELDHRKMPGSGHDPCTRVGPQPLHELGVDDRDRLVVLAPDDAERKRELAQGVAQVAGERGLERVAELARERRAADEHARRERVELARPREHLHEDDARAPTRATASRFSQGRGWRSARRMTGRRTWRRQARSGESPVVETSTTPPTRSGACAAASAAIGPPSEWPTSTGRSAPSCSQASSTRSPAAGIENGCAAGSEPAEAGHVRHEHAEVLGKVPRRLEPVAERPAEAVDQHDRRPAAELGDEHAPAVNPDAAGSQRLSHAHVRQPKRGT